MSRPAALSLGELIEHWTLRDEEMDLVAARQDDTKLVFALLLRYYGRYGRFPRSRGELHPDVVGFVARAVKADPDDLDLYDWSGPTIKRHRTQIRDHCGFRKCGKEDGAKLAEVLAAGEAQRLRRPDLVKGAFLAGCRERHLEQPAPDQVDRYVRSALYQAGLLLAQRVADRVGPDGAARLLQLIAVGDEPAGEDPDLLRLIKASPGTVSLATLRSEAGRLKA